MGHAKKRGTYGERVAQSEKGIKSYEQFLESQIKPKTVGIGKRDNNNVNLKENK